MKISAYFEGDREEIVLTPERGADRNLLEVMEHRQAKIQVMKDYSGYGGAKIAGVRILLAPEDSEKGVELEVA